MPLPANFSKLQQISGNADVGLLEKKLFSHTALEDNDLWLVDLHDFAHDRLEQHLIGGVVHAILQWHIYRIVPPPEKDNASNAESLETCNMPV